MNTGDKLTVWEKAALLTLGAGGVINVLLYQLGYTLADARAGTSPWLFGVRALFAVCSFIGFDLTLVTAVMAMRAGRRSVYAWLTAALVLLAAGGMSLDVAEVVALPAWHAAPVAVLAVFALHLAAPRVQHRAETLAADLGRRETDLAQAGRELEQTRDEVGRLRAALEAARAEAETIRDSAETEAGRAWDEVGRLRAALAQHETAARQLEDQLGRQTLILGGRELTLGQAAAALGMSKSTLGRKLAGVGQAQES